MAAPRIWFNQTYRGTYQLIGLLREAREVTVLGSHPVPSIPYLQVCDEVVDEPASTGAAFVDEALDICRRHSIDVFVPGREMEAVSRAEAEFAAIGVRLQVSPADAIETLAVKAITYELAARLGVDIPAYELVDDIAGYRAAVERLTALGTPVCFKPDFDHGGHGFRLLDETAAGAAALAQPPSVRIAPSVADGLLAEAGRFNPLIVSEYLPGNELSIDCLSAPDGTLLAALPRSKGGLEWTREVVDDALAVAVARTMVAGCGLRYLSNVQVRYAADRSRGPVLLEVNTRAASGMYQSCRAAGINLPALALALTLGEPVDVPEPTLGGCMIVYNEAMSLQPRALQPR